MSITNQVSRKVLVLQNTNAEVSTNQVYAAHYEWRVDGQLNLPTPTVIDSLKHGDAAFSIYRVDVSVNTGGTSTYQIIIKSYDTAGLNPITHVSEYVTISGDKNRAAIAVLDAAVPENRSLECSVYESTALVPASDMTVTLVAEDFANLEPARYGHRILNASNVAQAQRSDLKFNGSGAGLALTVTDNAIDNRTEINYSLTQGFIGDIQQSMLSEAQFQALRGSSWVLMKGQDITGTALASLLSITSLPDQRGKFLRSACEVPNKAFGTVTVVSDTIVMSSHLYSTGFKVRVTGSLPAPLAVDTDYYVIVVDPNTIKLATTYAGAIAGTAINLTTSGGSSTMIQWEDPDYSSRDLHQGNAIGSRQDHALQNITGSFYSSNGITTTSGAFTNSGVLTGSADPAGSGRASNRYDFDASNVANTSTETRPSNRIYNTFIKIN